MLEGPLVALDVIGRCGERQADLIGYRWADLLAATLAYLAVQRKTRRSVRPISSPWSISTTSATWPSSSTRSN